VTVIATGFGPSRLRRKRRTEEPAENESETPREVPAERFEISEDLLEVPSFLRDG
jgi:hypothetical protein